MYLSGVKRFPSLLSWRQNQSPQIVASSTCGKGGDLHGKSKYPMSNAVPKRESREEPLG